MRDKGKEQFQYLIAFKQKRNPNISHTTKHSLRRTLSGSSGNDSIPFKETTVNTNIRQSNQNDTSSPKIDLAKGGRAKVGRIAPGQSDAERTKILQSKKIAAPIYSGEADVTVAQNAEELESHKTNLRRSALKKIADEFQIYGDVYNQDMDIEISVSAGTVNETSNKILTDTKQLAKLLPILNETVQTAVGIETHVNRYYYDDNTRFVHELLGGYIDDEYFVPVRFGVKENNQPGQGNKLYVIIDQEKIKRAEVSEPTTTDIIPSALGTRPAHVISIAQIVKKVKDKDVHRYLPDR